MSELFDHLQNFPGANRTPDQSPRDADTVPQAAATPSCRPTAHESDDNGIDPVERLLRATMAKAPPQDEHIGSLEKHVAALTEQLETARKTAAVKDQQLLSLRNEINELRNAPAVDVNGQRVRSLEKRIAVLTEQLEINRTRRLAFEADREAEQTRMTQQLETARKTAAAKDQQLLSLRNEINELRNAPDTAGDNDRQQVETLEKRIAALTEQLETARHQLQTAENAHTTAMHLQSLKNDDMEFQVDILRREVRLAELRREQQQRFYEEERERRRQCETALEQEVKTPRVPA